MLSSCPSVAPSTTIGVRPLACMDELFDEVRRLALHEDDLRVAARAEHARRAERVFGRHRRRQVVGELHVQRRERARDDAGVVAEVEARRERAPFAGRADVHQSCSGRSCRRWCCARTAPRCTCPSTARTSPAAPCRRCHSTSYARAEARNEARRDPATSARGRLARRVLEAHAEVQRQLRRRRSSDPARTPTSSSG